MLRFLVDTAQAFLGHRLGMDVLLRPVILHVTLTDRCNLRCAMCNVWQVADPRDVPLSAVNRMANSPLGRSIALLDVTGGEPFLSDVPALVSVFPKKQLRQVLISTNGTATQRIVQQCRRLLEVTSAGITVNVSLDGLGPLHDHIRGVAGTFARADRTVQALLGLRKENPRLRVAIKSTLMPENIEQLRAVYEYARRQRLEFTTKPVSIFASLRNTEREFPFMADEARRAVAVLRRIVADESIRPLNGASLWERIYHCANLIFHEHLADYLNARFIERTAPVLPRCQASFLSVMLDSDGTIHCCPTLMVRLGHADREPFRAIWRGRRVRNVRRMIRRGECQCFSQCDQMPSLLLEHMATLAVKFVQSYRLRRPRHFREPLPCPTTA